MNPGKKNSNLLKKNRNKLHEVSKRLKNHA